MAVNTNAFTYNLGANSTSTDEHGMVNQSSPAWVLTFVSWEQRDTLRTAPTSTINYTTVRSTPLVVENDCVQVSVNVNKNTLTPSLSATLLMTDINYETAIAPGDFVIVNMLNWETDARRVADQARNRQPINGFNDGFKGVFKVQGVRESLSIIDQERGTKAVVFKITGFAFTEFNNTIYFNQNLVDQSEQDNINLWFTNLAQSWASMVNNKGLTNVQDIMKFLIEVLIGNGIGDNGRQVKGLVKSANTLFYIPSLLGNLLNVSNAVAAKDVYNYLFGIQDYNSNANQSVEDGFNPFISQDDGRFFFARNNCAGETISKPEYWNQVQVWSIMSQFANTPINELYTCFRISPDGDVMPTVVYRQIPFTNADFVAGNFSVTRFMNLPRWKISPSIVYGYDLGRDEAARINFVQYFGRSTLGTDGFSYSAETAQKNYLYDLDDVKRSGLRPYIVTSNFDEPVIEGQKEVFRSPYWARIVGDCLIGGQLKMNGTIECKGIVHPIAVGDNLQFNGVIYHIEQINHSCIISVADGRKKFVTTISVSNGLSIGSNGLGIKYSEMTYPDAYQLRQNDWKNNQILPGVSESQDTYYRSAPNNPDTPHSGGGGSFPQPNTNTSVSNPTRNPNNGGESENT